MCALLQTTERGLFCAAGDFYIDPWKPVDRAVITHAHSDHARSGSAHYLCSAEGVGVLHERVGMNASIQGLAWGKTVQMNEVSVSFHPSGHILGSAQVRLECGGNIWVVSGDYKIVPDRTCTPFELVRCHTFITESTFGLPIYSWDPQERIFEQVNAWWKENQTHGWTSVLFAYSLGKAQRLLGGLDPSIGPIMVHGSVSRFLPHYAAAGISLPTVGHAEQTTVREAGGRAIVIAPSSAENGLWLRKFGDISTAFASGWMTVRGMRRRQSLDRGFVLSDHVDWPGLLDTIEATGAEEILVTHGFSEVVVRWLREKGRRADVIRTQFSGDGGSEGEGMPSAPNGKDGNAGL